MGSIRLLTTLFALLQVITLLSYTVKSDDEDDLSRGIDSYRSSLKLTSLSKNKNAECLAEEIAEQFKDQPCSNTTGANTVPGTENQFSNFPALLSKCHLNITVTKDGTIMPACVPGLVQDQVLSNFTKSQYSESLNDTKYTGIGIGSDNNWIVVVLTTSTPEGNYAPSISAGFIPMVGLVYHLLYTVLGLILVCLS